MVGVFFQDFRHRHLSHLKTVFKREKDSFIFEIHGYTAEKFKYSEYR